MKKALITVEKYGFETKLIGNKEIDKLQLEVLAKAVKETMCEEAFNTRQELLRKFDDFLDKLLKVGGEE